MSHAAKGITFVIFTWVLIAGIVVLFTAGAHATPRRAWDATILCAHMSEDTADPSHLRLVEYATDDPEGPLIVMRCRHNW